MTSNLVNYNDALMALEADGCVFSDVSNFNQQPFFPIHRYLTDLLQYEEALLVILVKSDALAYAVNQFRQPILTPVGHSLYEFLCCLAKHHLMGGIYESSPFSLAVLDLLDGIGARYYSWQRHPYQKSANNEADEMSLTNYLVVELRKLLSSRRYKAKLIARKKDAAQQYSAAKSILDKRLRSGVDFSIYRFDLISLSESGIHSLPESLSGWAEFLKRLDLWMIECSHFSYIWRREFTTQTGYRYHLVVMCNSDARDYFFDIWDVLGKMWRTAPKNTQANIATPVGNRAAGGGAVATAMYPGAVDKVLQSLRVMLNGEVLARLITSNGQPNWGSKSFSAPPKKQATKEVSHV